MKYMDALRHAIMALFIPARSLGEFRQPGAGVARAHQRLMDHRIDQAHRLRNAAPAKVTRQQIRSYAIRGR